MLSTFSNKQGFSLSEILVAVALLGLVCAVAIPTILGNLAKAKNTSVLREAFTLITDMNNTAVSNGEFDNVTDWDVSHSGAGTIVDFIGAKLNYSKQCLVGDYTSKGCAHGYPSRPPGDWTNAHSARWILQNGVKIQGGCITPGYGFTPNAMVWVIMANAYADETYFGEDTIFFICNPSNNDTTTTIWGTQSVKPGSCGGYPEGSTWSLKPYNDKALGIT
jgi:prepilin-type N-terminal cleavage/methylation domain-containing protein